MGGRGGLDGWFDGWLVGWLISWLLNILGMCNACWRKGSAKTILCAVKLK